MKKFMAYLDDGENCYKIAVPAESIKDAKVFVEGNGEIIKVVDVSDSFSISAEKVAEVLTSGGFSQVEVDFIVRTLTRTQIAE